MARSVKKTTLALVMSGMLLTQTGCIAGLITGQNYLYIAGALMGAASQFCKSKTCYYILAYGGALLDEKNPGRQDAVNPLPMDRSIADKMNVTLDDIQQYNDELPQIHQTNRFMESQVAQLMTKKMTADELTPAARAMGLQTGQSLIDLMKQDELTHEQLENFAQAQGLTVTTAKLYLTLRFDVHTP